MTTMSIHVQPAPNKRVEFAQYAMSRAVSTTSRGFAVGLGIFPEIPDHLLQGALVDDQPWVTPADPDTPQTGDTPTIKEN